ALHRHLWPGLYTSGVRTGDATEWRSGEIVAQVLATRDQPAVDGELHFSMEPLLSDRDSVGTVLRRTVYAAPALVPPSPWMMPGAPAPPEITLKQGTRGDTLLIAPGGGSVARWWLVQWRTGGTWTTRVIDASVRVYGLTNAAGASGATGAPARPDLVAVTAVDRTEQAGGPSALRLP
ncbi:MAG: hypothetical protein ACREN6_14850, partial [Gemmatimonadaceae bacterium]